MAEALVGTVEERIEMGFDVLHAIIRHPVLLRWIDDGETLTDEKAKRIIAQGRVLDEVSADG